MQLPGFRPALVAASAALLAACAAPSAYKAPPPAPLNLADVLAESDQASAASQNDKAAALLKTAATAYPRDKEPWLRLARMHFASNKNGDAITHALEVLQRDPGDRQAHSILAVSGMRIAARSMGELGAREGWNEERLQEAQALSRQISGGLQPPEPAEPPRPPRPVQSAAPVQFAPPPAAPAPRAARPALSDSPLSGLINCKNQGACDGKKK